MKKILCLLLVLSVILVMAACGAKKIVHCDSCGKEIAAEAGSNVEEDWILYCEECNQEIFGDDPVLGNG